MPFKDFTAGDILTAVDVDSLLMRQTIMTFADSAARDTALSAVLAEGMFCYLNDTNAFQVYDGSAWADVSNPGDITAVTAGTALTGGGTSGAVTLNVDLDAVNTTTFITDATTARTLISSDAGNTILFTSASAITITVDASTDFAVGTRVDIMADGAGAVTVTADTATVAAAEVATTSGSFTIGGQYSAATLLCVATDEYRLIGNITAV
jgi:hypothetical protein